MVLDPVSAAFLHARIHREGVGCCCPGNDVACPKCPTQGHPERYTTELALLREKARLAVKDCIFLVNYIALGKNLSGSMKEEYKQVRKRLKPYEARPFA